MVRFLRCQPLMPVLIKRVYLTAIKIYVIFNIQCSFFKIFFLLFINFINFIAALVEEDYYSPRFEQRTAVENPAMSCYVNFHHDGDHSHAMLLQGNCRQLYPRGKPLGLSEEQRKQHVR